VEPAPGGPFVERVGREDAPGVPTPGGLPRVDWRRRAVRNTVANGLSRVVAIAASFLLTPIILHAVGTESYGLWVLLGAIVAYGSLLDLGIGGALTKYVAEHRARGESAEARGTIATAARLYVLLGASAALLGTVLSRFVPSAIGIPPDLVPLAQVTMAIMAIGLGVAIPCATGVAVLQGLQRWDIAAAIAIAGSLLVAAGTVAALSLGWGIPGIAALAVPVPIATLLLAVGAIRRVAPDVAAGPRRREPGAARRIIGFSWPLLVIDVAGRLQSRTDEIVVAVALSLDAVTPYALGRKLSTIPQLVAQQFALQLLPLASEFEALDEHDRLRALYLGGVRVSLAIALPLTGCLLLLAGPILDVWVGPGFESGAPIVVILAIAAAIDLSLWPAGFVLQGIARHRWLAPIALGSGVANLVLSVALARPFGIVGVALGTLLPTTVEAVLLLTPYTLRTLGIGGSRFVSQALAPALLPVVPMLAVLAVMVRLVPPTSAISIVALVAVAHLVYGLFYLAAGPAAPERRLAHELAVSVLRWLRLAGSRGR